MLATYSQNRETKEWRARVKLDDPFEDFPNEGEKITITKKSGETSERVVGKKIWDGEDDDGAKVALFALD